jgi:hypothetical protein
LTLAGAALAMKPLDSLLLDTRPTRHFERSEKSLLALRFEMEC